MGSITQDEAAFRVAEGIAKSRELGVAMNIAIVDNGGHLVQFSRMDLAWLGSIDLALKKAKTAVYFRMPSSGIGEISQPGGPVYGIEHSNAGLVTFGGGMPITDDSGEVIGAVGVSGGTVEQDCAVAESVVGAPVAG
ncbi:GlcG/HbpS family heme-binding protein [Saccharothrix sp. Mg75]|uniref:GlcG/HbpS family heme-binding protein n=1 Tax=Saccharothrix sp. Mg75 TaxID=3445357 RepID=UPI003EED3273